MQACPLLLFLSLLRKRFGPVIKISWAKPGGNREKENPVVLVFKMRPNPPSKEWKTGHMK
jgi:hypothetical protein